MKSRCHVLLVTILAGASAPALAQPGKEDPEFVKKSPTIGEPMPELVVRSADGKEFATSSLRGHYTVLAFGCLT